MNSDCDSLGCPLKEFIAEVMHRASAIEFQYYTFLNECNVVHAILQRKSCRKCHCKGNPIANIFTKEIFQQQPRKHLVSVAWTEEERGDMKGQWAEEE